MTTTSTLTPIDPGLAGLAFSHGVTLKLAEAIADDQLTTRLFFSIFPDFLLCKKMLPSLLPFSDVG